MRDFYDWTVEVDNQNVLSRKLNVTVINGAQGIYEAHTPGTATLTRIWQPEVSQFETGLPCPFCYLYNHRDRSIRRSWPHEICFEGSHLNNKRQPNGLPLIIQAKSEFVFLLIGYADRDPIQ